MLAATVQWIDGFGDFALVTREARLFVVSVTISRVVALLVAVGAKLYPP